MSPTTETVAPPVTTDRPIAKSEVFALQATAAAADLHVECEPVTGRYWVRVGDLAYVYVDRAGLAALGEQITKALA